MTEPPKKQPPTPHQQRALIAATRLQESMEDLRTDLQAVRSYGERNRRFIWGLIVSIALDVALSIVVAVVAIAVSNTNDVAAQNRDAQIASCNAGNETRAVSRQLWNYVLDLSSQGNLTPEKRAQIDKFRAYMEAAYAPRDCSTLGK